MGPGWQSLDLAVRAMRVALRSVDFQKTPAVVAVVQSVSNTLAELISHYTTGTEGAGSTSPGTPSPKTTSGDVADTGDTPSADADSAPSQSEGQDAT